MPASPVAPRATKRHASWAAAPLVRGIRSCGPLDVTDVEVDGTRAVVRVGQCTVELVPRGSRWQVAKVVRD